MADNFKTKDFGLVILLCFILWLLVFKVVSAFGEPIYGYDTLGLAKQDVGMIIQEISPNSAIGVLEGTFGNAIPSLERLISTGKVIAFRAHLGNGPCQRAHNCDKDEPGPYDLKTMRKRAQAFENLKQRHPNVGCFLSPYLEHDVKDKELVNAWVALLEKEAPHCRVVISAFTGFVPKGELVEKHGNVQRGDIVSNDGSSLFDSNSSVYRTNGRLIVLGWIHRFNGRLSSEKGVFVPPKQRKWKATRDNMRQITRMLFRPEELKPATTCREIKKPELWKTNAEDYGYNPDGRGDRPLFISRSKMDGANISDRIGRRIGCLKYYGPYERNLYRHYVGSCSGDSGVTLMDKAKSEWIFLRGGGRCLLTNAIRRKGYFK